MQMEQFEKLSQRQKQAMIIAMHVRNSMEEFHTKNLNDEQMRQLNPIIRRAILEGLTMLDKGGWHSLHSTRYAEKDPWIMNLAWLVQMIPGYWEIPSEKEIVKKMRSFGQ